MYQIEFNITVKAEPGWGIQVIGSLPSIGNWDPNHALKCYKWDDQQWESQSSILVGAGQKFEFKLIQVKEQYNGSHHPEIKWENLPNNSNRKYKAQFNCKLQLVWSNPKGRIHQKKSSYQICKKLPGIILGVSDQKLYNPKQNYKNSFDPQKQVANGSDSQDEHNNDSFGSVVRRKVSRDIRDTITKQELYKIYYGWRLKQSPQIFKEYGQLQHLILYDRNSESSQFLGTIKCEMDKNPRKDKMNFMEFTKESIAGTEGPYNNLIEKAQVLIFLSFQTFMIYAEQINTKKPSTNKFSCLYLKHSHFLPVIEQLQKSSSIFENVTKNIQLMCFDEPETNIKLFKYFQGKNKQNKCRSTVMEKRIKEIEERTPKNKRVCIQEVIKEMQVIMLYENVRKNTQNYESIQSVSSKLEEPDFYIHPQAKPPTNQYLSKNQVVQFMEAQNSILIVDAHIFETDPEFFHLILPDEKQELGRMAIIVADGIGEQKPECSDWFKQFRYRHDICVIFQKFKKLALCGNTYEPLTKYQQIIDFLKCKSEFYHRTYGGLIDMAQDSITYQLPHKEQTKNNSELINKIEGELKQYLTSTTLDNDNFFDIQQKDGSLKINFMNHKENRLLKTIFKLKEIEDGCQEYDIFIISGGPHQQRLQRINSDLKAQGIKRLCLMRYCSDLTQSQNPT